MKLIKLLIGSYIRYKDTKTNRFFSQNQVNYFKTLGHNIEIVSEKEVSKTEGKKTVSKKKKITVNPE